MPDATGRFAPSPTGDLHLGNLRTALVAWLSTRRAGGRFLVRMEDLDRVTSSPLHETAQLGQLAALGMDWDGDVVRQSERFDRYDAAITRLIDDGRTYECFCTRREIRDAVSAPNGPVAVAGADGMLVADGAYPGTCSRLTAAERDRHRRAGRLPAIRLRADAAEVDVTDAFVGRVRGVVDDVVLRRNDGVAAYNLAVVVDDAAQGVTEVVRGDDLLSSTPRQVLLQHLLTLATPVYAHVPLILGGDGVRLAKRHGATTLEDLAQRGHDSAAVRSLLAASLGLAADGEPVDMNALIERFDLAVLRREPWVLPEDLQRSMP